MDGITDRERRPQRSELPGPREPGFCSGSAIWSLLQALTIAATAAGCSAINGIPLYVNLPPPDTDTVTIQSVPTGAQVSVMTTSGKSLGDGVTPYELQVPCSDSLIVTVTADGYQPAIANDASVRRTGWSDMLAVTPLMGIAPSAANKVCHASDILNVTLKRVSIE